MISIGLDISTKTIGLSAIEIIDGYITDYHIEHLSLPKTTNRLAKLTHAKAWLTERLNHYQPDQVAIEDFSLFMQGKSNAKTIVALAVMNTTVALTVLELTKRAPMMLNVNTVRAKLKPKGQPRIAKESLPEVVAKRLGINWNWLTDKKGKVLEANYDQADAVATNLASLIINELLIAL